MPQSLSHARLTQIVRPSGERICVLMGDCSKAERKSSSLGRARPRTGSACSSSCVTSFVFESAGQKYTGSPLLHTSNILRPDAVYAARRTRGASLGGRLREEFGT